jgi:hypothetical protein
MIDEFFADIIIENINHTIVSEPITVTPHENLAFERVGENCLLYEKSPTQVHTKQL